ncbi:hypothetical protein BN10_150001 [Phycicoccus elongatus Lp2]|uniref:Uncharacterized protein n=1 Tax=Phycicoccus elongatus Lp2 TaxID=1193181 RepID=N0DY92_9MICO|nr:hypothetical protein BN10_150001 [Phycicoccus elongatus Lp2]
MPRSPVRGPAPVEPVRAELVRALSVRVPGVLAGVARERQPAAPGRPEHPATPRPSPPCARDVTVNRIVGAPGRSSPSPASSRWPCSGGA